LSARIGARAILYHTPARAIDQNAEIVAKRNAILAAARENNWRKIMMTDDDITVTAEQIEHAARLLDTYPAVAFRVTDFPDHSTACHAHIAAGGTWPVRASGSALLLDMDYPHGSFPLVYNEDWLFLHELYCAGGVADAGEVQQLPYDPFTPGRAAVQEFGDVLAEGLYQLADAGYRAADADQDFWAGEIETRGNFLSAILARPAADHVHRSVRESLGALSEVTAVALAEFTAVNRRPAPRMTI
jgi:hypothetical protein